MTETVKIWIENFQNSNTTIEKEIDEIKSTISNERLWEMGSDTYEETEMHHNNIEELCMYLEWLEERKEN